MKLTVKLTAKELEVMSVLWDNGIPMTATEILAASDNRTWVETSIFIMMKNLETKGAVSMVNFRPTSTKRARVYKAEVTFEEVMAYQVAATKKDKCPSVPFDEKIFVDYLEKLMKEE